ncbi:UPF0189 protein ymdB [Waddlia chondrophila 2032/99]|uniref:UPF0189 protein ymdB n=1 Tax=Waddlia chondrophila 2032/99 TaxID=765953 RepID=F8LE80_9BACT|nr:UPF0189 protein ymdB [Waddlia chondrophila 2032/99]
MKLDFSNFFTHLIFHPFDADTKNERKFALVSSIALGIFSLFTVHLGCLIYGFFARKVDHPSPSDESVSKVAKEHGIGTQKSQTQKFEPVLLAEKTFGSARLQIYQGDLLEQKVDAIVNPANTKLRGGGGVDGIIGRAAGKSIYDECVVQLKSKGLNSCNIGDAYITGSGKLNEKGIKHVIHAVGPRGSTPDGDRLLKAAYTNSLLRADENHLETIAFPAISIGIFNFNPKRAAELAFETVSNFFDEHPDTSVKEVRLFYWTSPKDVASKNRMLELLS